MLDRKEFERKKEKWFTDIKHHIEQIEELLGKMGRKQEFALKKENRNYYYQNNTSKAIEHRLGEIKEIFEDAENEESALIMRESDEEEQRSATIEWTDYLKAVARSQEI